MNLSARARWKESDRATGVVVVSEPTGGGEEGRTVLRDDVAL